MLGILYHQGRIIKSPLCDCFTPNIGWLRNNGLWLMVVLLGPSQQHNLGKFVAKKNKNKKKTLKLCQTHLPSVFGSNLSHNTWHSYSVSSTHMSCKMFCSKETKVGFDIRMSIQQESFIAHWLLRGCQFSAPTPTTWNDLQTVTTAILKLCFSWHYLDGRRLSPRKQTVNQMHSCLRRLTPQNATPTKHLRSQRWKEPRNFSKSFGASAWLTPHTPQHVVFSAVYLEIVPRHIPSALTVNGGKLVPKRFPVAINVRLKQMMKKMLVAVQFVGPHHEIIVASLRRGNFGIWKSCYEATDKQYQHLIFGAKRFTYHYFQKEKKKHPSFLTRAPKNRFPGSSPVREAGVWVQMWKSFDEPLNRRRIMKLKRDWSKWELINGGLKKSSHPVREAYFGFSPLTLKLSGSS